MAAVEWNLAALTKWEEITGRSYAELADVTDDMDNVKVSELSNMLICGMYGAEYPNGEFEEIKQRVLCMKPAEMQDFFSALQQKEEVQ